MNPIQVVQSVLASWITLSLVVSAGVCAHYDPELGRWLERDPLGLNDADNAAQLSDQYADGMNLYQYVVGDPSRFDPYGLRRIRFAFRGLGGDTTFGDGSHMEIAAAGGKYEEYNWSQLHEAVRHLMKTLDANGNRRIEESEIDNLDLGVSGYSQGGAAAILFTRHLNFVGKYLPRTDPPPIPGWKLCVAVPVKILVTLDPRSWQTLGMYSVPANVAKANNYYQKRGGYAIIYKINSDGKTGTEVRPRIGTVISAQIKGKPVNGATNHRVDVMTGYKDGITGALTRLHAKDVNHDTLPWYVKTEASADLR